MSDLSLIASRLPGAQGAHNAAAITGTVPDPPRNFVALDNGTILRGTVQGRDKDGLVSVNTDHGVLKIATNANLQPGSNVTLEVRSVGDRLQVVVLAVDQPAHGQDLPAVAAQGAAQQSAARALEDQDAQATHHQPASAVDGTARSSTAAIRQSPPQPTVIVAGTRLTAIVVQSVPRDLLQSSAAAQQQADHGQPSTPSDIAKPSGSAAFTAEFRQTPTPPISASLMPEIHARIAALFAEPPAGPETAPAAVLAAGEPALSADMRDRITALFVGTPTGEPVTNSAAQTTPSPVQAGTNAAPTTAAQNPPAISPQNATPANTIPATTVDGQAIPATPLPVPTPAPAPAQAGLPVQAPAPTASTTGPVALSPVPPQGAVPANHGVPASPLPPPTASSPPAPPSNQPPQPAQPSATTASPGSSPADQADLPPPSTASPSPIPGIPAPKLMPISPEILAQLLADAAESGSATSIPGLTPLPGSAASTPAPAPLPQNIPTNASPPGTNTLQGTNILQAATIANLLTILEQGPAPSFPALSLTPSAPNSVLQDPAVSPSPISPVSITPLPSSPLGIADGTAAGQNATGQSATKPAATPPAAAGQVDASVDPKAGVPLTAIVASSGKVPLTNAATGNASSGTIPGTVTLGGGIAGASGTGGAAAPGGLANASTENLTTATAANTLSEETPGAINLGGNQLSGPLPTGTELRLRVLNIQQPAAPNTSIGTVQANTAAAGKTTLVGQILGHTPAGHPVIHTSLGDLVLQQQASLPVGAKITLALEAVDMAVANSLSLPVTPQMTALNLAQGWPTLLDLLITLQHGMPSEDLPGGAPSTGGGVGALAHLLQPGSALAAGMADAIDAFRAGDFEKLFGPLTAALKVTGGKQESVRKLRDEFGQLSSLSQDKPQQDWRCFFLPLWDDGRLQQINLFYRRPRRGQDDKKGDEATRFVVEVNFTKLGGCQLDGLIRKKYFDLMIRSHQELPLGVKREIAGLFAEAREIGNYSGDVSFQTTARFPVLPLDDIAKDTPSVTA